ncbi:hypothetical protein HHI36_004452 [Cryptolaemus montrouzieri]|uniref:Uncharacterized protein n=1 Tax=Cryptolaemus montrouzieri TaxID=559131 RepID=A0ABD2NR86_9CUCU
MLTTFYWILGVLVYFQETTAILVPVYLEKVPSCQGDQCDHQIKYQPVYRVARSQYLINPHQVASSNYHPSILQAPPIPSKCPLGHTIEAQQLRELNEHQKMSLSPQGLHTQAQYQAKEEKNQNVYKSSYQQSKNAYLPPPSPQYHQYSNNDIQQNQQFSKELSEQNLGKIKQTVSYDISHHYHHPHQSNNDAKSSTHIEQHHDLHHHSDGSEDSKEIDSHSGKHKDHNAYYKFEYSVNDHHTGDIKKHKEERSGDEVRGEYSLVEEDGNVRTVKYFADWKTGFHATVHNSKSKS